jgi:hypothetical protein
VIVRDYKIISPQLKQLVRHLNHGGSNFVPKLIPHILGLQGVKHLRTSPGKLLITLPDHLKKPLINLHVGPTARKLWIFDPETPKRESKSAPANEAGVLRPVQNLCPGCRDRHAAFRNFPGQPTQTPNVVVVNHRSRFSMRLKKPFSMRLKKPFRR